MEQVVVIIHHPQECYVIVSDDRMQGSHRFSAEVTEFRRTMKKGEKTLSIRKLPMEMIEQTAYRCIKEKLGIEDGSIEVTEGMVKSTELEESSDFYPGLTTVVCKHIIQARVVTTDPQKLKSIGADSSTENAVVAEHEYRGESGRWVWQLLDKVPDLRQYSKWLGQRGVWQQPGMTISPRSVRSRAALSRKSLEPLRDSLQVVQPWDESEVLKLLEEHQATPDEFG